MEEQEIINKLSKTKFTNVISLGFFCSVAGDIESLGLRTGSGPFDWVWSTWDGVFRSFKEEFSDFFRKENLYQADVDRSIYADREYNIISFHDFSKYTAFEGQYEIVSTKYKRRIDRFLKQIKEPTLFIRYIWNGEYRGEYSKELTHIEEDYMEFVKLIKKYNKDNEVVFVANDDLNTDKIPVFFVKKDKCDAVNRRPLYGNALLLKYLQTMDFDNRQQNLIEYNQKENRKKSIVYRVVAKAMLIINKYFRNEYIYMKQYCHGDYKC